MAARTRAMQLSYGYSWLRSGAAAAPDPHGLVPVVWVQVYVCAGAGVGAGLAADTPGIPMLIPTLGLVNSEEVKKASLMLDVDGDKEVLDSNTWQDD